MIDPVALSSITSAVAVLGNEYLKGVASEAGKATWAGVKSLLGWNMDPPLHEIPQKVTEAIAASPIAAAKLLELLQSNKGSAPAALVGNIEARGGNVVVANTIITNDFHM